MNSQKQYPRIIEEAYINYISWWENSDESVNLTDEESEKWLKLIDGGLQWGVLSKDEFIEKCKTNDEFFQKWGLKIVETEFSLGERKKMYEVEFTSGLPVQNNEWLESKLKTRNIPAKRWDVYYKPKQKIENIKIDVTITDSDGSSVYSVLKEWCDRANESEENN